MHYLKWLFIIGVIALLALLAGYVLALRSEAYKLANDFVMTSSFIEQKLGKVRETRLHPFGYSIRVSGVSGRAEFLLSIQGVRANGDIDVALRKEVGVWMVSAATLNGEAVKLNTVLLDEAAK